MSVPKGQYYVFVPADLKEPCYPVKISPENFLSDCYDLIGCDCIEAVPTSYHNMRLICDESGKLKDEWRINPRATYLRFYNTDIPFYDDIEFVVHNGLAGDCIMCKVNDAGDDLEGFSIQFANSLSDTFNKFLI